LLKLTVTEITAPVNWSVSGFLQNALEVCKNRKIVSGLEGPGKRFVPSSATQRLSMGGQHRVVD
jgi:hypothetical protein